jgi:hypothetical protein
MSDGEEYWRVEVLGVGHQNGQPVVLLQDERERKLPIVIGPCEAVAIHQRLTEGFEPPRPLAQDLALNLYRRLGAVLTQLRIDSLFNTIYYSKLEFEQEGRTVELDCRPSDGIALALAAGVPIFVAESVMSEEDSGAPGA